MVPSLSGLPLQHSAMSFLGIPTKDPEWQMDRFICLLCTRQSLLSQLYKFHNFFTIIFPS